MPLPFAVYTGCWLTACLVAFMLFCRHARQIALFEHSYYRLLLQPWKVATFLVAALGMALLAPYSGDPTWDYVDVAFMSIFSYLTAPWVVSVLYDLIRGQGSWRNLYLAFCTWMFSASWSYDLYIYLRDGLYPLTWDANIYASSVLYLCAGMLWSLEWQKGRGVVFGFMLPGWPEQVVPGGWRRLLGYAALFILFVSALMVPFFI